MERKDRINAILQNLGIAYTAFAMKCGLNPSNLKKMLDGEQTITDKTLLRIVNTYQQFNLEWLKTGEGDMLQPEGTVKQEGCGNVYQKGTAGHDLNQTNNSEKILADFVEGLKSQSKITSEVLSNSKMLISENKDLIELWGKSMAEISEHRKLIERLISIIEKDKAEKSPL